MATITARNGQQYTVPDAVEGDYLDQGFTRPGAGAKEPVDYAGMKVIDLRALVAERNEGRDDVDLIPDGKKAELVAALEADDARPAAAAIAEPAEPLPATE